MQKKLYICCPQHLKPMKRAETELRYKNRFLFTEELENADLVYAFGTPTEEMERELKTADDKGIPVVFLDDKFRNREVYEALLSNDKKVKVVTKEKSLGKER